MFERFTDQARRAVVTAQAEARELWHNYIGTEHLLLALLSEPASIANRALANLGVTADQARTAVVEIIGRGDKEPSGHIPFTPRAKKAMELSLREAVHLKQRSIGAEHILLGLLREGEGVAAQVLLRLGADLAKVRREVVRLAGDEASEAREEATARRRPHTPAALEVLAAAEQLAGEAPVGSHHLLEALARVQGSVAAHALVAAGVDVEVLTASLDQVSMEGTTDLTPEEQAARQTEIQLIDGEVHVVLRDTATVERVRELSEQLGGPIRGGDPIATGLTAVHQAVTRYLDRLQRRLAPPEEETTSQSRAGISGVVWQAMHSRLRRRGRSS